MARNKNSRKLLILVALFLAIFGVGGTISYLTDTKTKSNTFTFGNVMIEINEPKWIEELNKNDKYTNVLPGQTVNKDPQITLNKGSQKAYVFMKVAVPTVTIDGEKTDIFTYPVNSAWTLLKSDTSTENSVEYNNYYYYFGANGSLTELIPGETTAPTFETITVNSSFTADEVSLIKETVAGEVNNQQATVMVTGYGIQKEGLPADATPAQIFDLFSK